MSAPTGPSSSPFVPDPIGRGTIGLVTSCVVTLSLCVWTAIHLNINPSKNKWRRLLSKLGWTATAIIAPEIILWRAIVQFVAARELYKRRNSALKSWKLYRSENSHATDAGASPMSQMDASVVEEWSLQLGFFAVMGGFKVRMPDEHARRNEQGFTLTPLGVVLMAEANLLPNVGRLEAVVEDKTKVDSLAKGLVCIQTGWMLIQTIARKASGLPITLLELNTLAHVGCAVLMYIIWWHKPKDVLEPETIDIDDVLSVFLADDRFTESYIPVDPEIPILPKSNPYHEPESKLKAGGNVDSMPLLAVGVRGVNDDADRSASWLSVLPANTSDLLVTGEISEESWTRLDDRSKIDEIKKRLDPDGVVMLLPGQRLGGILFTPRQDPIHLTKEGIKRLALVSTLLTNQNGNTPFNKYLKTTWPKEWWNCRSYLESEAGNLDISGPGPFGDFGISISTMNDLGGFILIPVLSICYGGIHATSWNGHFPSYIEQTM